MPHLLYKIKRITKLGLRSIAEHQLRSFLTALGIIFGVGSVIAMLAIGEGASYEAREQIRSLGSNNVIIRSIKPSDEEGGNSTKRKIVNDYGIKYEDLRRIRALYPAVEIRVPTREIQARLRHKDVIIQGKIIGTVPWALEKSPIQLKSGRFINDYDQEHDANVVVLSEAAARRLFPLEYPLGKHIYLRTQAFEVIGIMQDSATSKVGKDKKKKDTAVAAAKELYDVYIPFSSARSRFGEVIVTNTTGMLNAEKVEIHQLTLTAPTEAEVVSLSRSVRATLQKSHRGKIDFEITVPLELLKQAEQTKRIFNIVLGSIAAISLLVGGIGIMNIMLASVTERTREIGIRRALGATRGDIVVQFLTEALLLSLIGGIIGIGLGVGVPKIVTHFAGLVTIIQADSIILAFTISLLTGVIFGIYPAIRAAALSPIEALRHE